MFFILFVWVVVYSGGCWFVLGFLLCVVENLVVVFVVVFVVGWLGVVGVEGVVVVIGIGGVGVVDGKVVVYYVFYEVYFIVV